MEEDPWEERGHISEVEPGSSILLHMTPSPPKKRVLPLAPPLFLKKKKKRKRHVLHLYLTSRAMHYHRLARNRHTKRKSGDSNW